MARDAPRPRSTRAEIWPGCRISCSGEGMNRLALPLIALTVALGGCASSQLAAEAPAKGAVTERASDAKRGESLETPEVALATDRRAVGDYVTFAFTGDYRKDPITLTQRVTSRSDASITIEYAFTEKNKTETLRATWSTASDNQGQLIDAKRLAKDGSAQPLAAAAFEEKIGATVASTDQNEALLGEKVVTVSVAGEDLAATTTTYQVRLGDEVATLETIASPAFAWGDLGGKITKADGKIYFEAKLVDAGATTGAHASLDDL